ncbi:PREDICTED: uncharacterized protein LOC108574200 [Habropoda laboriosa]|uniref:uncharacterized protein LOC108574200 n=1 Tax=Habropoda laboriosa TaxID=597456 RepID=UPI00083D746F|nr:PREDICTED: uncharacterized protein LOC108574200 [Habropoda laboriosa]
MVLNLLNLYSLIFALFEKINSMKEDFMELQPTTINCTYKSIECNDDMKKSQKFVTLASLSLILASNVTGVQHKSETPETTLSTLSLMPENLFLNPILDEKSLEEIYNVGDYSLDYTYNNYDEMNTNEFNETLFFPVENTTEEIHSTTEVLERNDTFDTSTIFTIDENFTETIFSDLNEEMNGTSVTSVFFNDSTVYDETTEETNNDTSTDTTENTINEEFNATSFIVNTTSTDMSTLDEYSMITTLNTSTESTIITTIFTEESSIEITDKMSTIDSSSSTPLHESVIPLADKDYTVKCFEKICTTITQDTSTASSLKLLDLKTRKKLRSLCWETMFGQELAKLTVMDLVLITLFTLGLDFFRALFVRFMNSCWCWDLEKQFPQYGDFKIAENILHLVNNQGMIWMGMFFSPGLTALNLLKLGILMYLRSWAVLTCNVPHEVIFRASRSNNFYFALLLTMLLLCVLPVGYAIVWVEPSWHCGPFSGYKKIYHLATEQLTHSLPEPIQRCLDYIASPGIVIPLIVLMILIIYYMVSLTGSLREANNDLKIQLRHERTEERRKLFKIVKRREELTDSSFVKWKKMLPALSKRSAKSKASKNETEFVENPVEMHEGGRKRSVSEVVELTDVEQDIIPHDQSQQTISESSYNERRPIRTSVASRLTKVFHDSWESQSSDCAIIPEIRINEAEGKSQCHPDSASTIDHNVDENK